MPYLSVAGTFLDATRQDLETTLLSPKYTEEYIDAGRDV
jgi:hypothetical protein